LLHDAEGASAPSKLAEHRLLDHWFASRAIRDARGVALIEVYIFDESTGREIVKLNPMANWSRTRFGITSNNTKFLQPLHDQVIAPSVAACTKGDSERRQRAGGSLDRLQ